MDFQDALAVRPREDPIERITATGIKTQSAHYELDLIVFALGFHAFTGALDGANIRNEQGQQPSDLWKRGPRTLLGVMTRGFPNLFIVTAPGSPSVLANMSVQNEYHIDWIADCIAYMDQQGTKTIEPTAAAQDAWTHGNKSVLYIRVNFPDDLTEPISETAAYLAMNGVNSALTG